MTTAERTVSGKVLAQIGLLAVANYAAGRAGLLLAIPPGFATAVWPPSGIGLAAVLVWGNRVWPGILIASFLVNLDISLDSSTVATAVRSVLVALTIAAGSSLQAVLGASLIRRLGVYPGALDEGRDVVRFLAAGGPVACLVAATVGAGVLAVSGAIPWAGISFHWFTWWVGDSMGVTIFTPLVLVLLGTPRRYWRTRATTVAVPLLGLFIAFIVVFVSISRRIEEQQRQVFTRQAEALADAVRRGIDGHLELLHAVEGLFDASRTVEPLEFLSFTSRFLDRRPGIQAVEWVPRVTHEERVSFEAAVRDRGFPRFRITERNESGQVVPAGVREEYFPVTYAEPREANAAAMGFDLSSSAARTAAIDKARRSRRPVATGRIRLVQDHGEQAAVLVLHPMHGRGPGGPGAGSLEGFGVAVFLVEDMVEASLAGIRRAGIGIRIEDRWAPPDDRLLADLAAEEQAVDLPFAYEEALDVVDRKWVLRFTPTAEYVSGLRNWGAWAILAGGMLFTTILGAFLLVVTGRTATVEIQVSERTAELSRLNDELQKSLDLHRTAEERVLEYSRELESRNADLEEFAHVTSHDLQEPLRKITSFADFLEKDAGDDLPPQAKEDLEFITDGARRMSALVDDLLLYSRAGRAEMQKRDVDLEACLAEALKALSLRIVESGAEIHRTPLPKVSGNPAVLTQLFQNLLGNALKFSTETPRIEITLEESDEGPIVGVKDNGIGIDPAYQQKIYSPFQRLHGREDYEGTGIGLAICKKVVERHGGRLWVESEPGKGAHFRFTLSGRPASSAELRAPDLAAAPAGRA